MKFSHSIQFNAVPEWTSHYIAYSNLKKLIYTLEKEVRQGQQPIGGDGESSPLLADSRDNPDILFSQSLDREFEKIAEFYETKQPELFNDVDDLLKDVESFEAENGSGADLERSIVSQRRRTIAEPKQRRGSILQEWGFPTRRRRLSITSPTLDRIDSDDSAEDGDDSPKLRKSQTFDSTRAEEQSLNDMTRSSNDLRRSSMDLRSRSNAGFEDMNDSTRLLAAEALSATLKKRMISLYVSLCELRSFLQLNRTGFSKVLKKYDKTLDRHLRQSYLSQKIDPAKIFSPETSKALDGKIGKVEQIYADFNHQGNLEDAKRELRLELREHVVWERNTVWREMIGIERKAQAANLGVRRTILGSGNEERRQGDEAEGGHSKEFVTSVGKFRCPHFLLNSSFYILICIVAIFIILLEVPIMDITEQQNCLAMVICVGLLWATEAIPLFVTSLLVPFLCVVLRVVRTDQPPYYRMEAKAAASYVFSAMWTPVIMLLLGGFTIAAALSKYNIAKMMATFVLSKAGTKPRNVLITSMFVSMFASMWISNVASPVLCFSIVQPILRNLPSDSAMIKALLLGIALSANIGGAASPIASPQNLIALQNMSPEPGWGIWFFISLPVCIISILLIWVMLLITLKPGRNTTIVPIRPIRDKFTGTQWFITGVTLVTIVLWCVTHQLEPIVGDMGVVAIIPLVFFFGTGILTKEDFNNFLWTVIILAAGGLALGKAVNSSGLLHTLAEGIRDGVSDFSLYGVLVTFAAMILVVASFISHTVAALIVLPLVRQVGVGMEEPHPNLLVMGCVLMCSAAMALPTSGFPNMTAIMMEEPNTGQRYLKVSHFITRGIPASILTFAVVISVGYGLMRAAGL